MERLLHRPTNDSSRIEVHYDREIEPSFESPHVGDVDDPRLIWLFVGELLSEKIVRRLRGLSVTLYAFLESSLSLDAILSHDSGNTVLSAMLAILSQIRVDPRTAVNPITLLPEERDSPAKPLVLLGSIRIWSIEPRIESTTMHF